MNKDKTGVGVISDWLSCATNCQLSGVVRGIYEHGFYIEVTNSEQLMYVCDDTSPYLSVNALRVDRATWELVYDVVRLNQLVTLRDDRLIMYTTGKAETVSFQSLSVQSTYCIQQGITKNRKGLTQRLTTLNLQEKCGLSHADYNRLIQLVRTYPVPQMEQWQWLIGRGAGLTPAGDDVLFGYLAAMAFDAKEVSFVEQWVVEVKKCSTNVSAQFFSALAQGYVSQQISALFAWKDDEQQVLLDYFYHYGHTSGYDVLLGISLYLNGGNA